MPPFQMYSAVHIVMVSVVGLVVQQLINIDDLMAEKYMATPAQTVLISESARDASKRARSWKNRFVGLMIFLCMLAYCTYVIQSPEWANSLILSFIGAVTGKLID